MLNKEILKEKIKVLLNELKIEEDQDEAIERYAEKLSKSIDDYTKSAQVRVLINGSIYYGTLH